MGCHGETCYNGLLNPPLGRAGGEALMSGGGEGMGRGFEAAAWKNLHLGDVSSREKSQLNPSVR